MGSFRFWDTDDADGALDAAFNGALEGPGNSELEGSGDLATEGAREPSLEDALEGALEGTREGALEDACDPALDATSEYIVDFGPTLPSAEVALRTEADRLRAGRTPSPMAPRALVREV